MQCFDYCFKGPKGPFHKRYDWFYKHFYKELPIGLLGFSNEFLNEYLISWALFNMSLEAHIDLPGGLIITTNGYSSCYAQLHKGLLFATGLSISYQLQLSLLAAPSF